MRHSGRQLCGPQVSCSRFPAIWTFEYDDAARLTAVIDAEGDRTHVRRNSAGAVEAIVGPEGVTWTIGTNNEGFIGSITTPMADTWTCAYAPGGLLDAMASPTAHEWTFADDEIGRLTRDEEATLDRVVEGTERSVTYSSAEGRQTDYREALVGASVSSETTGNARSRTERLPDGFVERRLPDGTTVRQKSAPHPALGYIARYSEFVGIYTPGGAIYEATATQTATLRGCVWWSRRCDFWHSDWRGSHESDRSVVLC